MKCFSVIVFSVLVIDAPTISPVFVVGPIVELCVWVYVLGNSHTPATHASVCTPVVLSVLS